MLLVETTQLTTHPHLFLGILVLLAMLSQLLVALLISLQAGKTVAGLALRQEEYTRCGAPEPPAELRVDVTNEPEPTTALVSRAQNEVNVNTYMHVVTTERTRGLFTDKMLQDQVTLPLTRLRATRPTRSQCVS